MRVDEKVLLESVVVFAILSYNDLIEIKQVTYLTLVLHLHFHHRLKPCLELYVIDMFIIKMFIMRILARTSGANVNLININDSPFLTVDIATATPCSAS